MSDYYSASGKYSPLSFILWIVLALTALPLLAAIYAYAIWYIPIPYLNFFITGIFGFLIGLVISQVVLKIGKVRNTKLAIAFVVFGALTALYIHWAVWIDLAMNISGTMGNEDIGIATSTIKFNEVINLILQPSVLFEIMGDLNEVGVWGFQGGTVSGGFLTAIWIIEILVVLFVSFAYGIGQASKPFCEEENEWFKENELSPVSVFRDAPNLLDALSSGNMEVLDGMLAPAPNISSDHHAKLTLFDAKTGENFVSIVNEIAKTTDKGEIKFDSVEVASYLKISQEVADRLKTVG